MPSKTHILLAATTLARTVLSQQFSDLPLPVAWPGISTTCFKALNTTVAKCPGFLGAVSVNNERLNSDQLSALCTTDCQTGLAAARQTIVNGCTNKAIDVIKFYDGNVYPPTYVIDRFQYTYSLACRRDSASGQFCDNMFTTWLSQDRLTAGQKCSDCALGIQQLQLKSPFGYDADFAADFSSLTSSCSKSNYAYASPSKYTLSSQTTSTTTTAMPAAACATKYTVVTGDTCNSISRAKNVSTYSVIYAGGLSQDCSDLRSGLTLCLPAPCKIYTLQPQDTCTTLLSTIGNNVTASQFLSWNPNINSLCGNIYNFISTNICLSPPGGYVAGITITSPLAVSTATTPVPKPTNAPPESNSRCARWYTVQAGDTCSAVSVNQGISLKHFYFLNPEISTDCTNLLLGLAYCVRPVGDIATYPGYPTTSQLITLTSTSYSTTTSSFGTNRGLLSTATSTLYPKASGTLQNCAVYRNYKIPALVTDQSNMSIITSYVSNYANNCNFVAGSYYVSLQNLTSWNPSLVGVNGSCLAFQPGFSYCVGMTNTTAPRTGNSPCYAVNATEIVPGTSQSCTCYTSISGVDNSTTYSCANLAADSFVTTAQLLSWNPWLGSNCDSGLYANLARTSRRAVCIGINGTAPSTTPTTTTTTATDTSPSAPTKSGISKNCNRYYTVKSGDSCEAIDTNYKITFSQFYSWNPTIGANCQNLVIGFAYCVGVTTATTTTTTGSSPGPTRSGTPSTCTTYYTVKTGDSCEGIQAAYKITFATLYKWNPSIGKACQQLWVGYSVCVAGGP